MRSARVPDPSEFVEPPWDAPLDTGAVLSRISESATIAGFYTEPLVREARRIGKLPSSARERYIAFRFYPLREHVQMLIECAGLMFPALPIRQGLRKLGRAAPGALLQSTLGKVVFGSAEGARQALDAIARTYAINVRPSSAEVVDASPTSAIVRVRGAPFFLDSHHVGVFEGTMTFAGVRGSVKVRMLGMDDADFLCDWGEQPSGRGSARPRRE